MMDKLNNKEIYFAQQAINDSTPGPYELKDLYGDLWDQVDSPTTFGARFKKTVEAGELEGIVWKDRRSNNHQVYEVL